MGVTVEKKAVDFIEEGLLNYSSYVALNRALPSVQDGLKPIQRKILWSMWNMKATNFTKSANVTGEVFKYSPHGDSYMSLLPITQKDSISVPLITGKGNWATRTSKDLMPASSRYTECKLSPLSIETLKAISKGGVKMIDNYDGSKKMPAHLPFDLPFMLASANQGIGMGLASNTFSYNIKEVCDATIAYLKGEEIVPLVPDFPTGGEIANQPDAFKKIMEVGAGAITLYPKTSVSGQTISITEIPYYSTREQLIDSILKKVKDKTYPEIKDVLDLCGLNGFLVEVEIKRGYDAQKVLNKLLDSGILVTKSTSNNMVLANDGKPRVMGNLEIIHEWTEWKKKSVYEELKVERDGLKESLRTLGSLEKIVGDVDKFVDIVRKESSKTLVYKICKEYSLEEDQANYLIKLPLRQLNKDLLQEKILEIDSIKNRIAEIESMRVSDVVKIIVARLEESKNKYGVDRKTKIVSARAVVKSVGVRSQKAKVAPENSYVILTKRGFLTKLPENTRSQNFNIAPGDEIVFQGVVAPGAYVLIFSEPTKANKFYIDDIKMGKSSELGTFLSEGPAVLVTEKTKEILCLFEDGKMAKFCSSAFATASKRKVLSGLAGKKVLQVAEIKEESIVLVREKSETTMSSSDIRLSSGKGVSGVWPKSFKDVKGFLLKKM